MFHVWNHVINTKCIVHTQERERGEMAKKVQAHQLKQIIPLLYYPSVERTERAKTSNVPPRRICKIYKHSMEHRNALSNERAGTSGYIDKIAKTMIKNIKK